MKAPLVSDEQIIQSLYDLTYATESAEVLRAVCEMMYELRDGYEAELSAQAKQGAVKDDDIREKLAAYAHEAWSGWMKYMFEKGERRGQFKVGSEGEIEIVWIMPPWAVERWQRQMNTEFSALPESEKESDREEADRMLAIVARTAPAEGQS